jgi:hypothetical protein
LQRIVEDAATVAGARYAALGVYGDDGRITAFVHCGIDEATVARIGHLPEGFGLLGQVIVSDGPVRLDGIGVDPRSCGFPPGHPPMRTFLGLGVPWFGVHRYGNLYLTERPVRTVRPTVRRPIPLRQVHPRGEGAPRLPAMT